MNRTKLRRRCESRLRDLPLPLPFDVATFARWLADRRGRPIALCPCTLPGGLHGATFAGLQEDVVFYQDRTTPLHRQHAIVHELSHLLCEHTLTPQVGYTAAAEREAEEMTTLIMTRALRTRTNAAVTDPHTARVLGVLDRLGGVTDGDH